MITIKNLTHIVDVIIRPDLSLKAKGLYSCLIALGSTSFEDLLDLSRDGQAALSSALRELKDQGLVEVSEEQEKKLEIKIPEWAYRVFQEWSSHPQLISHRNFTTKMWGKLKASELNEDNAIQAIKNYIYVLQNSDFFKWKWTFDEFFQRETGARKFVHRELILKQYCNKQYRNQTKTQPQRSSPLPENKEISDLFGGKNERSEKRRNY